MRSSSTKEPTRTIFSGRSTGRCRCAGACCSTGNSSSTISSTSATRSPDPTGSVSPSRRMRSSWSVGRELELSGGYTFISRYTYGHSSGSQYVAGNGDTRMNFLLGSPLGPDADRGFIKGTFGVSSRAAVTLEGATTRYGAGSLLWDEYVLDWRPGMDNDPSFPSPPILHAKYLSASLRYDLDHGSYISAGAWVWYRDRDGDDFHERQNLGWLEVVLDL